MSKKGFAVLVDLGNFDCCAMRRGNAKVEFYFRLYPKKKLVEASITQDFAAKWVVDKLFSEDYREVLTEIAQRALALTQQQLLANDDRIIDGEAFTIKDPQWES